MKFIGIYRLTAILLFLAPFANAQQRPLLTEDPRLIDEDAVVTEVGFGYQHSAGFPVSRLTGDLYSIGETGLHFGLGKRAEFQITGVVQNYLRLEDGSGSRNDWGDFAFSTKIKLVDEGKVRPAFSFRPTIVLPTSSFTKDLGTDGTDFFGNLLLGKTLGSVFLFGNAGLGIIDDPTRPTAQLDVFTFGIAAAVAASSRVNILGEWNGRYNWVMNPSRGGESRGQTRLGLQIKAAGFRWDAAATAGTFQWDHKVGFVAGLSKEFKLGR
jgi:hypothetical protein